MEGVTESLGDWLALVRRGHSEKNVGGSAQPRGVRRGHSEKNVGGLHSHEELLPEGGGFGRSHGGMGAAPGIPSHM